MRRKCGGCKKGGGLLCGIAAALIAVGAVWLCCLSYRFILIGAAALLVAAGILLIRNCR